MARLKEQDDFLERRRRLGQGHTLAGPSAKEEGPPHKPGAKAKAKSKAGPEKGAAPAS